MRLINEVMKGPIDRRGRFRKSYKPLKSTTFENLHRYMYYKGIQYLEEPRVRSFNLKDQLHCNLDYVAQKYWLRARTR